MASPLRLPAGLITLLAGPLHPTTAATVMPNLWLLCGSYSRLGYSGRCQAPGWSMHLQETYTAWWMASSDEIGQGIRKRGQGGHSCDGGSPGRLPQGILAAGHWYGWSTILSIQQRLLEGVGADAASAGVCWYRRRAAARPRPVRACRRGERRRCCTSSPDVLVERASSRSQYAAKFGP